MNLQESLGRVGEAMNTMIKDQLTVRSGVIVIAPTTALLMRCELDTGDVFFQARALEERVPKPVLIDLINGALLEEVYECLGKGTMYDSPPVRCYKLDTKEIVLVDAGTSGEKK